MSRLEVTIAKVQQSLPELKRDGNTVLYAVSGDLLFDETSASKASEILAQMDHIPKLAQQLKDDPEAVISDFKQIRDACGFRILPNCDVVGSNISYHPQ